MSARERVVAWKGKRWRWQRRDVRVAGKWQRRSRRQILLASSIALSAIDISLIRVLVTCRNCYLSIQVHIRFLRKFDF
jgi:hypothetical protein